MPHLVLLGDSILDNGAYVGRDPDVIAQTREAVGARAQATLLAVDGHVTMDVVARQLPRLPQDASHLVVSVGGNDALGSAHLLSARAGSVAEAIQRLADAQAVFRRDYQRLMLALAALRRPTAVCTIYDANYPEPQGRIVRAALSLFNDVITRAAFAQGFDLIDLRLICDQPADYANPIEPSAHGGAKIAAAISTWLDLTRDIRVSLVIDGQSGRRAS